jgi:hypothetical protein
MAKTLKRLPLAPFASLRLSEECLEPVYGETYRQGFIGFTHATRNPVSRGIAYFTRWSRMSDMHVSHVLVVTGENECVEALAGRGVVKVPLEKYFACDRTQIFFRKPRKLNAGIGRRIAGAALAQVGARYDHLLLAAQMLEGSFLRRWILSAFKDSPDRFVGRLMNRDDRWICSELAAYCLDCQPEYADRGILAKPNYAINPQELFEDAELFAAWKNEKPGSKKSAKPALAAKAHPHAMPLPQAAGDQTSNPSP